METYILDTNLFFNMEAGLGFGQKTEEVVKNITQKAGVLKKENQAQFMMPPRAIDEFLSFFEDKKQPFINDFLSAITIKSPDISKIGFSATVFYHLIDDIRQRSYRGLAIGEDEIKNAGQIMQGAGNLSKKEFEIKIGTVIKTFRDRYRNATRTKFLDSVTDLDLIVLAKEQNGYLVTSDEGVIYWGRQFGVKEMPTAVWKTHLPEQAGTASPTTGR